MNEIKSYDMFGQEDKEDIKLYIEVESDDSESSLSDSDDSDIIEGKISYKCNDKKRNSSK